MNLPKQGVWWDSEQRRHVVLMVLTADEAAAHAHDFLPPRTDQLLGWAEIARTMDRNTVWVGERHED